MLGPAGKILRLDSQFFFCLSTAGRVARDRHADGLAVQVGKFVGEPERVDLGADRSSVDAGQFVTDLETRLLSR